MIRTCCITEFYGRNAGKENKPCLNRLFHTPTFRIKGWFQVRIVLKFILVSVATRAAQGCPLANMVSTHPCAVSAGHGSTPATLKSFLLPPVDSQSAV